MKVLGLASYPAEAAATRYRLAQYVGPLAEHGIELTIKPFLSSKQFLSLYNRKAIVRTAAGLVAASMRRVGDVISARRYDVLLVQREAMLFGPPIVERLSILFGRCPMVLDLDDATYVSYTSPTYGRFASWFKWFKKTDELISKSALVTCGNRSIAEYVTGKHRKANVIPTVVDTAKFKPPGDRNAGAIPILGWIGTHSTFPYLQSIFPALERVAAKHEFKLKVVGAGRDDIKLNGAEVENLNWKLEREVADFQSFDIGLYPITADEWSAGKSGFKAIQYMAVGIPYVVTPIAACNEIGVVGKTHFPAATQEEWQLAIERLIVDVDLRLKMGEAGRRHVEEFYNLPLQAERLASSLREALEGKGER